MTNTTTLSARIAALEAQAAPLNELNAELAQLVERCNVVSCRIQDAVQAQHLLTELEGHAARLFGDSNSAANSEPMPEIAPQSEAPATQTEEAETNASTVNTLMEAQPEPSINSESNSEEGEHRSAMDIMVDWAKQLQGAVTPQEAADQTGVPWGTVKNYLPALAKRGLLEREPGTGTPHNPTRYRRPVVASTPAPKPAPKPLTEVKTDHLPRDLPPLVQSGVTATEGQMQAVLIALAHHNRPMSKSLLLGRLNMKADIVEDALRQLAESGRVAVQDGRFSQAGAT